MTFDRHPSSRSIPYAIRHLHRLHHVDIRVLSLFLDAGADPNSRREQWITPLIKAASQCHIEGCRLLLAAGADINAKDALGFTALMVAAAAAARVPKPDEIEEIFGRAVAPDELKAMSARTVSSCPCYVTCSP